MTKVCSPPPPWTPQFFCTHKFFLNSIFLHKQFAQEETFLQICCFFGMLFRQVGHVAPGQPFFSHG